MEALIWVVGGRRLQVRLPPPADPDEDRLSATHFEEDVEHDDGQYIPD